MESTVRLLLFLSFLGFFLLNFDRNKGVKVVLDVPDNMWDAPSAEITQLKKYVRKNSIDSINVSIV